MGKIAQEIRNLQIKERLTLPEIFAKYPHLASLQHKELLEELELDEVREDKQLQLLLD
jgi:hypothetical protein